jgi:predicted helicase
MAKPQRKQQRLSIFEEYVSDLRDKYKFKESREHAYRPALQNFIEGLDENIQAINDAARIECGAPDFIVYSSRVPVGYIEAKDLNESLDKHELTKQIIGYHSLGNLILTDYLEFRWYQNGKKINTVKIGSAKNGKVEMFEGSEEELTNLLSSFLNSEIPTIRSATELAERLAITTASMRDLIVTAFKFEDESKWLQRWLKAFRNVLLDGLTEKEFADMFAQTLTYGFFAARVHHNTEIEFSRFSAAKILPKTNPFLRRLFAQFAGVDMPDTISWAVDEIVEILKRSDMTSILKDFGNNIGKEDPVVHFYETFLAAYDPKLRQKRGVYYTPTPVVDYLVNSTDQILIKDFKKPNGLADDKTLILDPAVGTASFLYKVIEKIYSKFEKKSGQWNAYVEQNLLNRIFGFEILMAPYSVSHLKLGMQLQETGYDFKKEQRLGIFLTNTLEEAAKKSDEVLFDFLSEEANAASSIKRNQPIMVVVGNPPYAVSSQNKGKWIGSLIEDYKKGLNEKKINLDDDFIKFIRFAQWRVETTGYGVVALITNNVFLDGLTHRVMRKRLSEVFDKIYILNLHGHMQKQETAPDGEKDENVFDIQQGVSINIFVRTKERSKSEIFYKDLWGDQQSKYDFLSKNNVDTTEWSKLDLNAPNYFFVPKEFKNANEYDQFISLKDIFSISQCAIVTDKDALFVDTEKNKQVSKMRTYFSDEIPNQFVDDYELKPTSSYDALKAKVGVSFRQEDVRKCLYRPFDYRWMYYKKEVTSRAGWKVMEHVVDGENLCLVTTRQVTGKYFNHILATNCLSEKKAASHDRGCEVFPLFQKVAGLEKNDKFQFRTNFTLIFKKTFEENIAAIGTGKKEIKPEQIFFYILAVLNSPSYQTRYFQNLKIAFPRIPFCKDIALLKEISTLGHEIFNLQILDFDLKKSDVGFPEQGNFEIKKVKYFKETKRLFINATQYFENVSLEVWNYESSGYPVVAKWLKDRKDIKLNYEEIETLRRVIISVEKTIALRESIDEKLETYGGWKKISKNIVSIKSDLEGEVIGNSFEALQKIAAAKRIRKNSA